MLEIDVNPEGTIRLSGRFDASQVNTARAVFDEVQSSRTVDFEALDYISSAGLGVLLRTQQHLMGTGGKLKLINMKQHIRLVFEYAGFHQIFEIE